AAAGELGDVAGADEADQGGATYHRRQEGPADRQPGPGAQPGAHVAHHSAGRGEAPAERRENGGEQAGQAEQGDPGPDRRRPGPRRGETGQQQQAGAEEGADVEGGSPGDRQVLGATGWLCHASSLAETGSHAMANIACSGVATATPLRD